MDKLKRYIIFLIGLFINSLGVSLITKAALGTSPISSIPYVLSLIFPFTLGQFTIYFSVLLVVLQLLILRRKFKVEHLLQIPISIAFGYFIDLTMEMLSFVNPQLYIIKIAALLIGCAILGFGVYTELLANVAMLPGESFVRAVVEVWHTEFGVTKVTFDVSMSLTAVILSFVFCGQLQGVREGTDHRCSSGRFHRPYTGAMVKTIRDDIIQNNTRRRFCFCRNKRFIYPKYRTGHCNRTGIRQWWS